MPNPLRYEFSTPNLPTSVYYWLKEFQERHHVSRWHTIIAAIKALRELEQENTQKCQAVIEWAKKF